ncbi:hypothetical protein Dimus_034262 [Dionaea muscipula]
MQQPITTSEMQAINTTLSPPSSHHHHQIPPFDDTVTPPPPQSSHDDFLEQILAGIPNCSSWPDLSSNCTRDLLSTSPTSDDAAPTPHYHFDDSASSAAMAAAKSFFLQNQQQQLLLARGATVSGLIPLPMSMPNIGDSVDSGVLFDRSQADVVAAQLLEAGDGSVQALYNGFGGSVGGNGQIGDHQNFVQGGTMAAQNYGGAPVAAAAAATTVAGMSQGQGSASTGGSGGQPPQRQRVRARRGQATDPHSIAERLRRERIAERMKALQELVPNANKTDKASMLDEIIDYVKFLQLQVKVLSMSRLGGAAGGAPQLVTDISSEAAAGVGQSRNGSAAQVAATNSTDNLTAAENQVAKLMEEDMGSAMQYLQGKGLCLMPISLATAISTATCHSTRTNTPRNHYHNLAGRKAPHSNGGGGGSAAGGDLEPSSPTSLSAMSSAAVQLKNTTTITTTNGGVAPSAGGADGGGEGSAKDGMAAGQI